MKPPDPNLSRLCSELPPGLLSKPLQVSFLPHLKAHRGKLLSGLDQPGRPVHAASFIRRQEIVLERQLQRHAPKLKLILIHEIFHFVWANLGNPRRFTFKTLIQRELAGGARGDLGESSAFAKENHRPDYICESFCDTAAWLYAGVVTSRDFTLAPRWRQRRRDWFLAQWPLHPD